MDYDENDISPDNLQLVGEGRAKSFSALRPYDFPRFEFDDSLQGHLKFDNLVETEVFLGIQSQEHNQWIEDLSRGSNGMEFNSTPADPCSISRRDNVWSEATSSESVEMLLKSVGQEEMMPGGSIIQELDVTVDQGTLSKHVESSNGKLKEKSDAHGNTSEATLPKDETLKNYLGSSEHIEQHLENSLAALTKDEVLCENISKLTQNALCGNGGTMTDERQYTCNAESISEILEESTTSAEKTMDEGDFLDFPRITDHVDSTIGSTSKASQQVDSSVPHVSCIDEGQDKPVSSKVELENAGILPGETGVISVHTCSVGSSPGLVTDSGMENLPAILDSGVVEGEFELKSFKGDDFNLSFTTSIQNKKLENASDVSDDMDRSFDNCQSGSCMNVIVEDSAELGNIVSRHCASPKQLMDPTVQLPYKQDSDNMEDISVSPLKCKSVSEMSLLLMEVTEASTAMGENVDEALLSSAADHKHIENSEGCLKHTKATGEDSVTHLLADDTNIPMQVIQDDLDHQQADFPEREKDMCKATDADKEILANLESIDSNNIGTLKNDHKTKSLEASEGLDVDFSIHKLAPQTSGILESGKKEPPLTSVKTSIVSADQPDVGLKEIAASGFHTDNFQKEVEMVDGKLRAEVDNASKVGVSLVDDTMRVPISEISAMSPQHVEKIEDISSDVPASKEALVFLSLDSKESSLKEYADLASGAETMIQEKRESGQTADFEKTSCGSPTIISSSEPSQPENNNQEEGRGYHIKNEVKGIQSTSEVLKRIDMSGDDGGFSFKVNASADTIDRETGKDWSPFPDGEKSKVLEETVQSSKGKTKRSLSKKTPLQNAKLFDGEAEPGTSKGTSERKGRRGSAKGTTKASVKKRNKLKGPNQENISLEVDNSMLIPTSTSHSHVIQQHYGNVEATNKNVLGVCSSNVPDLNASTMSSSNTASLSPTCQQLFSDLQQVQLRAQIFVYGSLIQGHVPDEAFMVTAFGQYEGGRSFWERTWRAAVERVEIQKSSSNAAETPHSQSGASDSVKQGSRFSKVLATPVSGANSQENPPAVLSPIYTLMSPLWNISTPSRDSLTSNLLHKGSIVDFQHVVPPVSPYQTPIRNYVSHASLPLQTGLPGPWLSSSHTSSFSPSAQFRPVTMIETVKLTPVKDTSPMINSFGKLTTSSPAGHAMSPSLALGGIAPIHNPNSIAAAAKQSVDAKPRKRKKVPASDPGQVTFGSNAQTVSKGISNMTPSSVIPVSISAPSLVSVDVLSKPVANVSTVSSIELTKTSDTDEIQGGACSEETLSKVAEAKSQAEDAASLSDAAVTYCEDLWGQLAKQKDSGLTSETEAKLASSAVAIAAAASVAKAAAAAARIACNAALQAKLMADNALHSSKICSVISSGGEFSSGVHDSGDASLGFILKTNSVTNESSSILVAAKEAAKRRVETASAAPKQAENLDAIVKASELAAAAVSQAGKIVAMGEPLPLNELIEAGPEGYWKLPQSFVALTEAGLPNTLSLVGVVGSKQTNEKDLRVGIDHGASDMSKSSRRPAVIDTPMETTNADNDCDGMASQAADGIKEGSHIEVFNPKSVQKSAWFTADVLCVEKGKAYVSYNNLLLDKGSGNVQEWVSIESDGDKVPVIRTAHPSSALRYQPTGKRRRAALGDYVWCVGDRIDVWIDDCWWEGVVSEKNEKDETILKVHLSANGETQTVGAWDLRPSRSWINGKWIASKSQNTSGQSDTRLKKRQKLDSLVSKSKDEESNNLNSTLEKPEQFKLLTLSTRERMFDVGKTTTKDCNKHAARQPVRTNQQKEGSRVVFGVPKPTGKKQKFMDISANKNDKSNEANDTVKFSRYLMPQGAPPRGWKAPTRNDSKDKRIVDSRPRGLSSHKAQRNLPQRDNTRSKLAQNADLSNDQGNHLEDYVSHDDKSVNHNSDAFEESGEAPLSSLLPPLSTSTKRISSLDSKTERVNRGRLRPTSEKLSKIEDKVYSANIGKSTLDVSEPRRSNRRIQPTHRLLEGLQSSMAIPKLPAVSQDKSHWNLSARGK